MHQWSEEVTLKECEFRFNNRKQDIYKVLLGMFRKESLKLS